MKKAGLLIPPWLVDITPPVVYELKRALGEIRVAHPSDVINDAAH
jgi:hypothetical protein